MALQPVRRSAATTTETRNRTGASQLIGAGRWDVVWAVRRRSRPSRAPSPGVAISLNSARLTLIRCAARNARGYRLISGEADGDADYGANVVGGRPLPACAVRLGRQEPIIRHVPLETSRSGACGPVAARAADLLGAEKSEQPRFTSCAHP